MSRLYGDGSASVSGAIAPLGSGFARSIVRGAGAVTATAGVALLLLFFGSMVLVLVADEALSLDGAALEPALVGPVGSLVWLVPIAAVVEPLRFAVAHWLLLREAERSTSAASPPVAERTRLLLGPHDTLRGLGRGLLLAAVAAGIFIAEVWKREAWALVVRGMAPAIIAVAVALGLVLAIVARRRGPARGRWDARVAAVKHRWLPATTPTQRADRPRLDRALRSTGIAVTVGAVLLALASVVRQPLRTIDPLEYAPPIERAIDGVVLLGGSVIAVALGVLLVGWLLALVVTWRGARRAVRTLERGADAPIERIDAMLLDAGALHRSANGLGVAGWVMLAAGTAPGWAALMIAPEAAEPLAPLAAFAPWALAALVLAWVLGALAAARGVERRTRVHSLVLRDPVPVWARDPVPGRPSWAVPVGLPASRFGQARGADRP